MRRYADGDPDKVVAIRCNGCGKTFRSGDNGFETMLTYDNEEAGQVVSTLDLCQDCAQKKLGHLFLSGRNMAVPDSSSIRYPIIIPECCEFPDDLYRMLAETGGGTCDVTDCDSCWHGRSMEVLSEYVSSCDGCGEPVHHDLQVMDEETQLGYCKSCRPDLFTD